MSAFDEERFNQMTELYPHWAANQSRLMFGFPTADVNARSRMIGIGVVNESHYMPEPSPIGLDPFDAALLNAAAGVFTTLLTLMVGWLHERGADSRRLSARDEALKRVQFLEAWYRTRIAVAPHEAEESQTLILSELDSAMESVRALEIPVATPALKIERDNALARMGRFRRWFLLYKPSRDFVWFPRSFFYVSVALTMFAVYYYGYPVYILRHPNSVPRDYPYVLGILLATCLLARWFANFADSGTFFRQAVR
jgi:hypothetical protein